LAAVVRSAGTERVERLRRHFLWRRKLLSDLARVAARTAKAFVQSTLGEQVL